MLHVWMFEDKGYVEVDEMSCSSWSECCVSECLKIKGMYVQADEMYVWTFEDKGYVQADEMYV